MMRYLVSFVLLIIISSGCSEKPHYTEIEFWAMGIEGEKASELARLFEAENPDIKVNINQIPWTAAHEKLMTAFASETLPDVFQLGNTWIPEFRALDALESLDGYIADSRVIKRSEYFEGIWETNLLENSTLGIPWYVDTRVLFYRSDLLKKAGFNSSPRTWNDLYFQSQKIKQLCTSENCYSFFVPVNEWVPFILFGIQNNARLLRENDSYGDFSSVEFRESFEFLMKFFEEELAPKDMQSVLNIYQAFESGYFAFYITGPWNIGEFQRRLSPAMKGKWMIAPLPSPDENYPGYSIAGGASLVISRFSEKKTAAWKFIEFMSRPDNQLRFYKIVAALPPNKTVWENKILADNPYLSAFFTQLEKVKPAPKIPEWEQIASAKVQQYAELASTGKVSVEIVLKMLDDDVDNILEKRRWILKHRQAD